MTSHVRVPAAFYENWLVYFVGPLVGAAIAAISYRFAFAPPPDLAPSRTVAPEP